MEFLVKTMSPAMLIMMLQLILIRLGNWFKNKDADNVGADDAAGNVLLVAAPAIAAFDAGDENAKRKALKSIRDSIDGYLALPQTPKS